VYSNLQLLARQTVRVDSSLEVGAQERSVEVSAAKEPSINTEVSNIAETKLGREPHLPIAGLASPSGLAMDSSGNVYVADAGGAKVIELSAGGVQSTVGSGWSVPTGIAVDLGGNVHVADKSLGYIVKIPREAALGYRLTPAWFHRFLLRWT
jgi:DNA-binding beta-propeller fold protein YncE